MRVAERGRGVNRVVGGVGGQGRGGSADFPVSWAPRACWWLRGALNQLYLT